MARAWLALGANIGRPRAQLKEALRRLDAHPDIHIIKKSTIIETDPWGKTDQNPFLNMAIEIETSLGPEGLLDAGLMIEEAMGRKRDEKWGPRLIDIDVIAYGRKVIQTERLSIPHPYAHERSFVTDPLEEIEPAIVEWLREHAAKSQS
ncbi:2-amino-4-hydroxy-6-hydroxymethyldihydropteridine diphosphokinase [Maritalea mobilis]|jgi:2-amino-4-hydroxy-6-hydroxymethyldihydropteridine diphosphokinase|uniref:2-amino-4-hydroxy-6-hydroxymethyldihydropteridine pyrophosphokinase n=1 Tax=Maritalea mobilis TaxID=483324 RepID=A0A4V3DBH2_9HYPH|nr:2-amino-4-hydroxy-6-hydroxymethyldihydropteridine diphosphokinase [Maritalea mobilis]TDQ66518.1 2-amino-4-hydroxy-6-hydroxymethyldihydropteridine diphosphokinase [Maritalea mobilis]